MGRLGFFGVVGSKLPIFGTGGLMTNIGLMKSGPNDNNYYNNVQINPPHTYSAPIYEDHLNHSQSRPI